MTGLQRYDHARMIEHATQQANLVTHLQGLQQDAAQQHRQRRRPLRPEKRSPALVHYCVHAIIPSNSADGLPTTDTHAILDSDYFLK